MLNTAPDHMALEMAAQPDAVRRLLQAYAASPDEPVRFDAALQSALAQRPQLMWAACGSSFWAATLGAYALATLADAPCMVRPAHELIALGRSAFRRVDLTILVSQSGETEDTLEAMRLALEHAQPTLAVVNAPASQMARRSRWCIDTHAGPELAVPSTKGFVTQGVCALLIAAEYARPTAPEAARGLLDALHALPGALQDAGATSAVLDALVAAVIQAPQVVFLGRGADYPIAAEGALKLMESAQLPAQGFAMGEFKHGPMACLSSTTPVVAVVSDGPLVERTRQNLEQVRACGAPVYWIGPKDLAPMADFDGHHIVVPRAHPLVAPLVAVRILQSLAWQAARARALDPNRPNHLVKSVQQV